MENQNTNADYKKPYSPFSKLPRWGWWLIFGLTFSATLGASSQAYLKQWRASIRTDFPLHASVPGGCDPLTKDISQNDTFRAWQSKHNLAAGTFCGGKVAILKIATQNPLAKNAQAQCQNDVQVYGGGKYLSNADKQKSICMGNFGEPDSDVWLYDMQSIQEKRLAFCGTPCTFEDGFWINNDQFVLLQTILDNNDQPQYSFIKYDFTAQTQQLWSYGDATADWKTYSNSNFGYEFKNNEIAFELKYPPTIDVIKDISGGFEREVRELEVKAIETGPGPNMIQEYYRMDYHLTFDGASGIKISPYTSGSQPSYNSKDFADATKLIVGDKQAVQRVTKIKNGLFIDTFVFVGPITFNIDYAGQNKSEYISLYNQILSTFKFINK